MRCRLPTIELRFQMMRELGMSKTRGATAFFIYVETLPYARRIFCACVQIQIHRDMTSCHMLRPKGAASAFVSLKAVLMFVKVPIEKPASQSRRHTVGIKKSTGKTLPETTVLVHLSDLFLVLDNFRLARPGRSASRRRSVQYRLT